MIYGILNFQTKQIKKIQDGTATSFIGSVGAIFGVIANPFFIDTFSKLAFELVLIAWLFAIYLVVTCRTIFVSVANFELRYADVVTTFKMCVVVARVVT